MSDAAPLLAGEGLRKSFGGGRRWYGTRKPVVEAVRGVSFALHKGRTLGVVGESGCGKTTLARMATGLLAPDAGGLVLDGRPVAGDGRADRRALRAAVQLVFQDPIGALNPRKTVRQILEGPLAARGGRNGAARRERVRELMDLVGLRPEFASRHPHAFSGGQCQRIGIARALAAEPRLLVLDEPVSALDVSIQAQVLRLLRDLKDRLGLAYLFISHDLAVVETLADDVMVMKAGEAVEKASARTLFRAPEHPYTRQLLAAVPVPGGRRADG